MADWQNIRVTVALGDPELDNSGTFEAFTTGETWNGWAVPYFTAAEAQKVADWSQLVARRSVDPDAQDKVRWDSEAAAFVLENHAYPDEPETDIIEGNYVEELGKTLYGIGGYRWTWEPVQVPVK